MNRCGWVNLKNASYVRYHDEEWGVQTSDEHLLYELLILESFQAGLSWECVLNKREAFRAAFDNFSATRVADYNSEKVEELLGNTGIIRCKRKILAAIKNSRIFLQIQAEFGSFKSYLDTFTGGEIIYEPYTLRTVSPLSDALSRDLRRRGMSYVGSTIIYSYLQAIGAINAHGEECELCIHKRKPL
jgi:DNA-3-methyladenine glycosylase I